MTDGSIQVLDICDVDRVDALIVWLDTEGGRNRPWWWWWTRPGWRHVCAFVPAAGGFISLDSYHSYVDIRWWPIDLVQRAIEMATAAGWVHSQRSREVWRPRGPITCVTVTKALCGISAPCVWTPHALWKHLVEQDGRGDGWIWHSEKDPNGNSG